MVDIPGATKNGVQDYAKTLGIKAGHTVQAGMTTAIVQSAKRSKTLSVPTSLMKIPTNSVMSFSCGGVTTTVTSLMNLSTPYVPSPTTGVSGYFRPPLAPKVNLLQAWYLNPHSSPA